MFTKTLGGPLSPNTDYHDRKRLLEDAQVRDARLHDARHTAGTVLMLLGVPDRVIDQIMGWEPGGAARMRARYLHVPDQLLKEVAQKIGTAIWGDPDTALVDKDAGQRELRNVEGPHRERWGPSTSCPVRHWRRIRDSNS
ncbi:tyrosine-type recombinase/integrase [Streptomyces sp. NPDC001514]